MGDSGDVYTCDTLIIATGASANWLGCPAKANSRALAFRPAPPATASSSAARRSRWWAAATPRSRKRSFLTNFADKVTLIHRRDSLRADKTNQMRLAANKKIEMLYDTEIAEVLGSDESQRRHRRPPAQYRHRLAA